MAQKTKHRDAKLDKRRNAKDQNSFYKEKNKAKKTKKNYVREDM
jgi:hypothetical protein